MSPSKACDVRNLKHPVLRLPKRESNGTEPEQTSLFSSIEASETKHLIIYVPPGTPYDIAAGNFRSQYTPTVTAPGAAATHSALPNDKVSPVIGLETDRLDTRDKSPLERISITMARDSFTVNAACEVSSI